MQNYMPLKMGKEEKSAGSCERSLYLQNIPFIPSLPLKNLQLSRMGDSQVSVGQKKCVHLGFSLQATETFFPFDQYDSLKILGLQSVQLHTMSCHTGQDPGWGIVLFLESPAPAGIS